jgi:hypothetical protein
MQLLMHQANALRQGACFGYTASRMRVGHARQGKLRAVREHEKSCPCLVPVRQWPPPVAASAGPGLADSLSARPPSSSVVGVCSKEPNHPPGEPAGLGKAFDTRLFVSPGLPKSALTQTPKARERMAKDRAKTPRKSILLDG